MSTIDHRRRALALSMVSALSGAIALGRTTRSEAADAPPGAAQTAAGGPEHDFDFLLGRWQVNHRRRKKRLANNNDWEEFEGATEAHSILGGIANFNDSITHRPGGVTRGMGLRAFDAKSQTWYDWYLDGRNPTDLGVPGVGRFANGVATFFSEELFEGRPVKVRGLWSHITRTSWRWEQAFSPDGGQTWETNWVMDHTRIALDALR